MKLPSIRLYARMAIVFLLLAFLAGSCVTTTQERIRKAEDKKRLGEAFYLQGNYTQALKVLLEAERLHPDDAELHNDLGLVYRAKEKYDLAIVHFKKALAINPGYAQAKNNLGWVYLDQKKWDKAIPIFEELLEDLTYITPQFPLFGLGWAYYNKKNYALSKQYYLKALKMDPKFIKALRGLGLTYKALGRISEAISTLERAVEISPQIPHLHYDLGQLYALAGDGIKAREAYENVIKLVPHSALAAEAKKALAGLK